MRWSGWSGIDCDESATSGEHYRRALREISVVREKLPKLPLSLFLATSAQQDIADVLGELADRGQKADSTWRRTLPRLFVEERPLPERLAFSVERKTNMNQVSVCACKHL